MGTKSSRATQADMTRALRAVSKAGIAARVDVQPDGTISFVPLSQESPARVADAYEAWKAGERG